VPGISNHFDTITVIQATIQALNLTGLNGGVIVQEVSNYQDGQSVLPFVSICPYGPEVMGDELNDRDGVYYGTAVFIIAQPQVTSLEQRLGWRQSIRRNLHNQAISDLIAKYSLPNPAMPMNYQLLVEPGAVVEPKAWLERKAFVSGMIIRAKFQEPRQ
jgi:hypothetical protein